MRWDLIQLALLVSLLAIIVVGMWIVLFVAVVSGSMSFIAGVVYGALTFVIAAVGFYFLVK